jgi:hypothetical protein
LKARPLLAVQQSDGRPIIDALDHLVLTVADIDVTCEF